MLSYILDEHDGETFPPLSRIEKQLKEKPFDVEFSNSAMIVPPKSFEFKDGERQELRLLILRDNSSSNKELALMYVFTESFVVITGVKVL